MVGTSNQSVPESWPLKNWFNNSVSWGFMLDQCWVKSLFLYSEWLKLAYFVGGYSLSLFLTHVFCLALDRCDPSRLFGSQKWPMLWGKNGWNHRDPQGGGEAFTCWSWRKTVGYSSAWEVDIGLFWSKLRGNWDKHSFGIWACHDNVVRNHRKLKGHSALGHGS